MSLVISGTWFLTNWHFRRTRHAPWLPYWTRPTIDEIVWRNLLGRALGASDVIIKRPTTTALQHAHSLAHTHAHKHARTPVLVDECHFTRLTRFTEVHCLFAFSLRAPALCRKWHQRAKHLQFTDLKRGSVRDDTTYKFPGNRSAHKATDW